MGTELGSVPRTKHMSFQTGGEAQALCDTGGVVVWPGGFPHASFPT